MMIALGLLTLGLLGLWSLAAWGLYRLMTLDPGWVAPVQDWIANLPFAERLEAWIPGWQASLGLALDLTQSLLGWLGDAAPWIVWLVWGFGASCLLALAAVIALIVRLVRRPAALPAAA